MANNYFESALASLMKPQEKRRLLRILTEIRKGVEGPNKRDNINKLCEKGCLKQLILHLQQPHLDILNLILSILGNCCTERIAARQAVNSYDLLHYLNHVLKHHNQDSIQGRVFRIIGNMCQHWDRLANAVIKEEKKQHIVAKIVAVLKDVAMADDESCKIEIETNKEPVEKKTSEATITMALRALRELTNVTTVIPLIKECGILKVIGMIIIKYAPLWQSTKQHESILNIVLNLLYLCSKCYNNYDVIAELKNTDKGNAIVHLGKLVLIAPLAVVKITMNLSKVRTARSDLPFGDISQALIERLQDPASFTNGREDPVHRDYLKYLSFLIHSEGDREEILNAGLVPTLLLILRDYTEPTDIALKNSIIVVSMLRCMFKNPPLSSMLEQGVVEVLSEKLDWILGREINIDVVHEYNSRKYTLHKARKRGRYMSDPCFMNQLTSDGLGIPCCNYVGIPNYSLSDFYKYKEGSPSPGSDTSMSSGPSFSPPSSPALSDIEAHPEDDESDSDDYSPVCTDTEGEHPPLPVDIAEIVDAFEHGGPIYDNEMDEDANLAGSTEIKDQGALFIKKQLSEEIIKLVKLFVRVRPVAMELHSGNLVMKLLMFLLPSNKSICPPDTLKVLLLVTETPEYFLGLIQTDFVIGAYKFSVMQHGVSCITCMSLCEIGRDILLTFIKLVDFGCGRGDIAHQLYRGSPSVKQKIVPAIPFLTDNKHTLSKLMICCGGLNIMLQLLQKSVDTQQKCISSLCVMATKLGIKKPTTYCDDKVDTLSELPIDIQHYKLKKDSTVVRFKLDDGSCVPADRDFLSQKSEYFNRLLCGEFKESWEEEIELRDVPNKPLKLLFMLLQYDISKTEIHKFDVDLEILLEVIGLTERYLMEDLCACLTLSVQYFKFLPTTVPIIYQWSVDSGTNILRIEIVEYALVASMNESERKNMFQNILQLYSEDLANDVKKLFTRLMHEYSSKSIRVVL